MFARRGRLIIVIALALLATACGAGASATPTISAPRAASTVVVDAPTAAPASTPTALRPTPTATVPPPTTTPTPVPTATPWPTVAPAPPIATPARLQIPSIGVDAAVQQVGLTDAGSMGVPSNYTDVAWYAAGAKPGAPGNAVIDGHVDSKTGPAVFWRLRELQPGDQIVVVTADGTQLQFTVVNVQAYPSDGAPTFAIFGPTARPQLNLITCDGTFNHDVHQYDQRLVVQAVPAS